MHNNYFLKEKNNKEQLPNMDSQLKA